MLSAQSAVLDVRSQLCPPAPRPRPHPLGPLALLRVLARNPLEAWTEEHFERPIVPGGFAVAPIVVVSDPAAIRHVLLENARNYEKDWLQRRILSAGLTNGLLSAEGAQWRVQRRVLAPLFSRRSVMNFAAAMVEAARALVERLDRREGEVVDLTVDVTRATLEVLERTIFSDGLGGNAEEFRIWMRSYFEAIGRIDLFDMLGIPPAVPRPGHFRVRLMLRHFEAAIDVIISNRRRRLAADPTDVPQDILTLLLKAKDPESGEGLSETEIRANVLTFIAAGHETTANSIAWSLFLLSQSPAWQERVAAEAARVLDGHLGDLDGLGDRLVETRAVIDEAIRLYPPIAAISRIARGPDEVAGHAIKRGTMVVIAPYVLHRHRALWARPDYFDPTRFLDGGRDKVDRFAYLPFGAGPRVCIGAAFALQEASIILASIMHRFRLSLPADHVVWPMQKVTLRPQGGLPMLVKRR
jgi:cytochrome P450